jgi:hypothetical protein
LNLNYKKSTRLFLYLLLINSITIFIFSCCHQNNWATNIDWKEFNLNDLPGQEDFPDYGAVILFDQGKMEILGSAEKRFSVFERHRMVKIFNESGFKYANIAISYNPGSKIEKIFARTISPVGKITVLDEKDIYDVTLFPEYVYFSDQRAKKFTFPAVEKGTIIEYKYTMSIKKSTFGNSWDFQSAVPVLSSRFILVKPGEWDVHYRVNNIEVLTEMSEAQAGFKSFHKWEARDVPALDIEPAMPPQNEIIGSLLISPIGINRWDQIGQWYYDLIQPQTKSGKVITETAHELLHDIDHNNKKLKLIYEWVRDKIRYLSISIGIGGYQPHPAGEVIKNRYGDCKDMTTLLCALARAAGINVYQVLVRTKQNGLTDTSLTTQSIFNHVIAFCPSAGDSGIWMDATEKGCPFGHLPWYDQGIQGLVIKDKGEVQFMSTPVVPADSNYVYFQWQIDFDTTGNVLITGRTKYWGAQADELREELKEAGPLEKKNWLESYLAKRASGIDVHSFQVEGLDTIADPLVVSYIFRSAAFARHVSNGFAFYPGDIMNLNLYDYFPAQNRKHPVRFRFGFQSEIDLKIHIPVNWQFDISHTVDSLNSPFGTFSQNWLYRENILSVKEKYRLYGYDIGIEEYPKFKEFLNTILNKCNKQVMVKREL